MIPTEESPFPRFTRYRPSEEYPYTAVHVIDRTAGQLRILESEDKEYFRDLLDQLLQFTGLELLTWCILDNHYHLLLRVPNHLIADQLREEISEEQLFERMKVAYSSRYIDEVKWRIAHARDQDNEDHAQDIIRRLKAQMFDLSKFMHMLKRRFSLWYNKKHRRSGTLWQSRFQSVLIEDSPNALLTVATYIDLNPVRAGIVDDPKDYRWCGYAEALAGISRAQKGLQHIASTQYTETPSWQDACSDYRIWMFGKGQQETDQNGTVTRPGTTPEQIEQTERKSGRLSRPELLLHRVRYFTAGVAIGSQSFVESIFRTNRHKFDPKRETGARPMRYGTWDGLCALRDLRKDVVTPSKP